MNKCIKCGCEFVPIPTSEDYEEGVFRNREEDNICESCWQDEFEEENTHFGLTCECDKCNTKL